MMFFNVIMMCRLEEDICLSLENKKAQNILCHFAI